MPVVDEDTARTINEGRETVGTVLSTAQAKLQRVFIVFVVGFMGTFYALRIWIWDFLRANTISQMDLTVAEATDIIARTPFDVILMQAKIGMLIGGLVTIPALLYYSREPLRERGLTSAIPLSRWHLAGFVAVSFTLFAGGVTYAYGVFFPFMFQFLAGNAVEAHVKPSFGIIEWTQFLLLLTVSFGIAAQLPLFMSALSYAEIVPYETFRDKWRHAVIVIFVFGMFFSPPDPFTLIMWAVPLVGLYVASLGLAKVVTNARRTGAAQTAAGDVNAIKRKLRRFASTLVLIGGAIGAFVGFGGHTTLYNQVRPRLPEAIRPTEPLGVQAFVDAHGPLGIVAVSIVGAAAVGLVVFGYYTVAVLRRPIHPREDHLRTADPADIDLDTLDASAIDVAPPEVFLQMSEEEMMKHARRAMKAEDREKAKAIMDRFDNLNTIDVEATDDDADAPAADDDSSQSTTEGSSSAAADEDEENVFASTAAGMLNPFTEDETTEDDIGGYYYDIAFILESITSKMFRIVFTFMAVLAGTFFWLYQGGLRVIYEQFLARVPEDVLREVARRSIEGERIEEGIGSGYGIGTTETRYVDVETMSHVELINSLDIVIALHPVEVLIFEIKVSTLAAVVVALPMFLYYTWPAAKERGLVYGDRRVFAVWGGSMLVGFAAGTILGFFVLAPAMISYLVTDALNSGLVISYRLKSFFWLVIYTTVGIGFLANVVVTMVLFDYGGIVSYATFRERWREIVLGIFFVAGMVTPSGILTMLIFAIPIAVAYMVGLAILWLVTAPNRVTGRGGGEAEEHAAD